VIARPTALGDLRAALALTARPRAIVPTMGALHEGHVALIRAARAEVGAAGTVVVTVFVNPTQFGAGEDFDRYPRTLDADVARAEQAGADVVFTPGVREVYGQRVDDPAAVTVDPGSLADILEGAARPGHFRGVLTVVAKLFGLVSPDVAMFGEKDYQQLVLITRMVADLDLRPRIVAVPTVREPDGLARSSRNRFLTESERAHALALPTALAVVEANARHGAAAALAAGRGVLDAHPSVEVDYLVLTDPDLGPDPTHGPARALVAARVGTTRLIDNRAVDLR